MTVASGVLTYTYPLEPAEAEAGGSLYPTAIGSRSVYASQANPYTNKKIEGWKWDERTWTDEITENNVAAVPCVWDPVTSGITTSYFQSGIGSNKDLEVVSIEQVVASGINGINTTSIWAPKIRHGYYYDYEREGYLFSDDAEVVYTSYSGMLSGIADDLNIVTLSAFPKVGTPIRAEKYEWNDDDGKIEIDTSYRKKFQFSGVLDVDGNESTTYSTARKAILFENIDDAEPEFVVAYSGCLFSGITPSVVFNQQTSTPVGTITVSGHPDFASLDLLGYYSNSVDQLRLHYFPVDTTAPCRVFSWLPNSSGGITTYKEWTPVFSGLTITGRQVLVDRDLGTVEFGDTSLGQEVPSEGDSVGAYYYTCARVEYEPEYASDYITALDANVNPLYRYNGRGFIIVSPYVDDPASITLEVDAVPELSTDRYGPLYIGNTYAPLIATVLDRNGNPIEGLTVTFNITTSGVVGSFSGGSDEIEGITDDYGESKVFYNPPKTLSEIGENVTAASIVVDNSPIYDGVTQTTNFTLHRISVDSTSPDNPDDVFMYQVYTDDPLLGVLYAGISGSEATAQINEYYRQYFVEQGIWGPTGLTSGTTDTTTNAITWEDTHRILWDLARPTIYEQDKGKGRRMIVTEYDDTAVNIHNPTVSGAWVPMQHLCVEASSSGTAEVIFDTSSVVLPTPTGSLNSYLIVSPTTVRFQAHVYNERLGRSLYSNEVELKLDIPSYMNGTWLIDGVNGMNISEVSSLITSAMEGRKLPLGFRLRSNTITLAAALDGVTYLDVNSTDSPSIAPSSWPAVIHS